MNRPRSQYVDSIVNESSLLSFSLNIVILTVVTVNMFKVVTGLCCFRNCNTLSAYLENGKNVIFTLNLYFYLDRRGGVPQTNHVDQVIIQLGYVSGWLIIG